jgi:hypothetical protein
MTKSSHHDTSEMHGSGTFAPIGGFPPIIPRTTEQIDIIDPRGKASLPKDVTIGQILSTIRTDIDSNSGFGDDYGI